MTTATLTSSCPAGTLEQCLNEGLSVLLNRGYSWVGEKFIPALDQAIQAPDGLETSLVVRAHYLAGDLYDVTDAPRAAIQAYRLCVELEPDMAAAWREIARMNVSIGSYERAVAALDRLVAMDPDDAEAAHDLRELRGDRRNLRPLYEFGDVTWEAAEALAARKPRTALRKLQGKRSIKARQWRACAFGALDDVASALEEWKAISRSRGAVRMEYADWYYLPEAMWHNGTFWSSLMGVADRFEIDGIYPCDASLDDVLPDVAGIGSHQVTSGLFDGVMSRRKLERVLLTFCRLMARANHDVSMLDSLVRQYSGWAEAAQSLAELHCNGESSRNGR